MRKPAALSERYVKRKYGNSTWPVGQYRLTTRSVTQVTRAAIFDSNATFRNFLMRPMKELKKIKFLKSANLESLAKVSVRYRLTNDKCSIPRASYWLEVFRNFIFFMWNKYQVPLNVKFKLKSMESVYVCVCVKRVF